MLDVRRLRLLRELAHRGTIAAVAEALRFTPSAVSQQLAVLEREAGVSLLERTGRRVRLTTAGHALVSHADAVFEQLELAAAELALARTGLAGNLRLGAFPTAARRILPQALAALVRDHPLLTPMVDEVDPADVAERIRAGQLDAALVHEYDLVPAEPDLALATEAVLQEQMYLATRSEVDHADPVRQAAQAPWIVSRPGTLCHAMTVRACQAAGFTPQVRHRVDDFTTVLALVAAGQGVALVPQLAVDEPDEPPDGVVLTPVPMRRRTHLAFRRGAGAQPAIAALAAALRAAAGSNGVARVPEQGAELVDREPARGGAGVDGPVHRALHG